MGITLSLDGAKRLNACRPAIDRLIAHLGRTPEPDEEVPLVEVLDANPDNIDDICWLLAHLAPTLLAKWSADCAEAAVLTIEVAVAARETHARTNYAHAAFTAARALIAGVRAEVNFSEICELRGQAIIADACACCRGTIIYAIYAASAAYGAAAIYAEAAVIRVNADAAQEMRLWCRGLRTYLLGQDPGPVVFNLAQQ
jgi:hypothetical protein